DPVTALAAKANIDALAVKLRDANREGSLQHLRALVMTELLQGRDPLNQLAHPPDREADAPAAPAPESWQDDPGYRDEDRGSDGSMLAGAGAGAGARAPLPALINILVPAGTLLGWSTAPAQVGNWGLLDADETKAFASAASLSPRTRTAAPADSALGCRRQSRPTRRTRPARPSGSLT